MMVVDMPDLQRLYDASAIQRVMHEIRVQERAIQVRSRHHHSQRWRAGAQKHT
jgi:hypothetical protein